MAALIAAAPVLAAEFTPALGVSTTFSDNGDLEPDSTKDASLIATVSPGFNFVEAGARANATLNVTVNARYEPGFPM